MMKRLLSLLVLAALLSAYTFNGGYSCPTKSNNGSTSGNRNLTCGSCHPGAAIDPKITEGRIVQDKVVEFEIVFPANLEGNSLELFVNDNKGNNFSSSGATSEPTIIDGVGAQLFYELALSKSSGKKEDIQPVTFLWNAPATFNEVREIEIQGVISNLDGTEEGDYTFYKTIYVEPSIFNFEEEIKMYPTLASSVLHVEGFAEETNVLKVVNILGKTVYQSSVLQNAKLSIDVTNLDNGNYFLMIGEGKDLESFRFVVQK